MSEGLPRDRQASRCTGAQAVVRMLERQGVKYIFGLPGGVAIPLFDALVDSSLHLVQTCHEQGATHMADGYARACGEPRAGRLPGGGRVGDLPARREKCRRHPPHG